MRSARKLSWKQTADAMALAAEDWSEWDATLADGVEGIHRSAESFSREASQDTAKRCRFRAHG